MKAIRVHDFGGAEQLTVEEDVPAPDLLPGHVLVRIHAAGVNPVDTYIRSGAYATRPDLPYIPGLDGAGVIAELAGDVEGWAEGDRVFFSEAVTGTYAEFALCAADQLIRLPEAANFAQGAALWVAYATAYRALFQIAHVRACDRVLIHGASGGVGLAAVQWAAARGMKVAGTASSQEGRALVRAQGARHVFDHSEQDYRDALMEVTQQQGWDLIVEMAAHHNLDHDLDMVARRGTIAVVGCREPLTINPRKLMGKESDIRGVMLFGMTDEERREAARAIRAGVRTGTLSPIIQRAFALEDAADAHGAVMTDGAHGKIVLSLS